MATQYSNKPIVTNGLVYALDFGNQKSYVSGSTSARSLLFNPVTASVNAGGSGGYGTSTTGSLNVINQLAQFTGSQYIDTNIFFPGIQPETGNGTVMFVVQGLRSDYTTNTVFSQHLGLSSADRIGSMLSPTQISYGATSRPAVTRLYSGNYSTLKHFTFRLSSGSLDCFINGIPVSASAYGATTPNNNDSTSLKIGSRLRTGFTGEQLSGSLGLFQVYNRPLTSDEIWNNYQLTAPRYGLGPLQNKPYSLDENAYLFLQSAGITDPIITSSINTFVLGLKSASLWDKMIAIYPFVGTGSVGVNLTGSHRWNLKEPSLVTYPLSFTGSWNGSVSGSTPSGSGTNITAGGITPSTYYPNYSSSNAHISILSYDTPTSSSMLAGTGMTREVAVSTLAGDYGTPAAAYSVRKVRTAYSGALMDVRRSIDNVTSSIGYVSNGDLDTGSLLNFANAVGENSPGSYSGLAAAYSLRRVSSSYTGYAIDVRRSDNVTSSIGFDASGNLNTGSLLSFAYTENKLLYSNTLNNAAWSNAFGRITITTASAIAPDGTNTGTLLSGSYQASPNSLALSQVPIGSTSLRYTSVLYVSQSTSDYVFLRPGDNTACVYRFSTGVFTNVGPFVATLASESAANGWIKLTATTPANENYVNYYIGPTDNTSSLNYGNPVSPGAVYVWGAQLNSGSTALPYIQTTTAATTSSYVTTYVTQWYDQSGNNRHATQSVSTQQPIIVSSGSLITLKGKPSIYFDSVNDAMLTPTLLNKPYAVILVAQQEVGSFTQRIINSPTRNSLIAITRVQETVAAAGNISSVPIGLVNTPYVVSLVNDTTSSQVYSNTVNKTTTFNNNDFGLMNFGASGVYNEPAQAFVSEVIAYTGSSQISSSRSLIENNINNYYSIYTSSNAGYVARWYDQSGNNRHATQTATGSQPVIVSSGSIITEPTSSRPTLNFNTNKSLNNPNGLFSQPNTFFVVEDAPAGERVSISSTDASNSNQVYTEPASPFRMNAGVDLIGATIASGHRLATSIFNTSNSTGFQNGILRASGNAGTENQQGLQIGNPAYGNGFYQEVIHYNSNQSTNREAVEYGINNYYNIYPQTSSFTTSSFAIYATSGSVSASLNNDLVSGISSTGPLGFITVSRTGSNSLTIARNGVTSSFAVPASGALSTGIYLGAINNNGLALANSPLGISFASVGTGLSNTEVNTYSRLLWGLQYNLGRSTIVTQSLLVNLDAGNRTSYPGSGSTWFDISGNNRNGILYNGPTFNSADGGSIVFDGVNDYVSGSGAVLTTQGTITVWFKTSNTYSNNYLMSIPLAGGANGFDLGFGGSTTFRGTVVTTSGAKFLNYTTTYSDNNWHMAAIAYSASSAIFYYDGVARTTDTTLSGSLQQNANGQFYLGSFDGTGYYVSASISNAVIYNRALTAAEITQNYNATRGKFGI